MTRYSKSISDYPTLLPDKKITFLKAFNLIGKEYYGDYWHFESSLHSLGMDKYTEKFIMEISPLKNKTIDHNELVKLTLLLNQKCNGYAEIKDIPLRGVRREKTKDKVDIFKLIGTNIELEPSRYKFLNDSITRSINKLNLKTKIRLPYIYRIIQYNILLNELIRVLYKGEISNKKVCAYLLSRCGHLTSIPRDLWLTKNLDFNLHNGIASFTEYNEYISETKYKGKILLDVEFVNSFIKEITDNSDKSNITNITEKSNVSITVKSTLPRISMLSTESWKEDVKMAFIDFYNEFGVSPKPKKMCSFIQSNKSKNNDYAQYIDLIKFSRPLTIINNSIKEQIEWDTFAKSINDAKKQILGK